MRFAGGPRLASKIRGFVMASTAVAADRLHAAPESAPERPANPMEKSHVATFEIQEMCLVRKLVPGRGRSGPAMARRRRAVRLQRVLRRRRRAAIRQAGR